MSSIVELIRGEGRADAVVRSVLLALLLAVSVVLVWTTLSGRAPDAGRPDGVEQVGAAGDAPAGDETFMTTVR